MTPIVWRPFGRTEARLGSIGFFACDDPPVLLVVPKGYIGPTLVRRDLAIARRFAEAQRRPWSYVVDPTDAIPNPLNLVFLRSVRKLTNVRSYDVVVRRQPMRTIARLLVAIGGPDAVFPSIDAALEAAGHAVGGDRPDVVVRALRVDDVAAVQAVEQAAGEMFRSFPQPRIAACADHSPMPSSDLVELATDGRAWVVEDGGRVAGFLAVRVVDGCAHVEEVSVDPAFGRRGHATVLLNRAAAWAVQQELPAVTLTTFHDVPWNRPFYERRGYRVVAEDQLSPTLDRLLEEEDASYGLPRELRVVMRLDAAPVVDVSLRRTREGT